MLRFCPHHGTPEVSAITLSSDWPYPTDTEVVREVTGADLGITPITPYTEPTGFVVGGDNPTSRIAQLTEINGYRVEDLERWMRPQNLDTWHRDAPMFVGSRDGFLGPSDSLVHTLSRDNELVRSLGLSNTDLAQAIHVNNRLSKVRSYIGEGNHTYTSTRLSTQGSQDSPFHDSETGSNNHRITNATTGASVHISDLGGHLIERYGLYQGPGTSYRCPPEDIIATFGHLLDRVGRPERLQHMVEEVNSRHAWPG